MHLPPPTPVLPSHLPLDLWVSVQVGHGDVVVPAPHDGALQGILGLALLL